MKTITIKVNDEATEEKVVSLLKEHAPEMLEEEFSMLTYYQTLHNAMVEYPDCWTPSSAIRNRLSALLKIWLWKEKNDGKFGWGEVKKDIVDKHQIVQVVYDYSNEKLDSMSWSSLVFTTETPLFSTHAIAQRALKELEAEYKVVFNVK